LFQNQYAKMVSNIEMTRALDEKNVDSMERRAHTLRAMFTETEINLAQISVSQQRFEDAIDRFQKVLEMDTNSVPALNNVAFLRATASDPGLRNGNEAVRLAEHACELTHYREIVPLRTLAAAYAEAGRYDDAVDTARKVRVMALAQGQKEFAPLDEQLLELYESGRAYHQEAKPAP
jgi:tetratricopeptide (TPR) repeat protein